MTDPIETARAMIAGRQAQQPGNPNYAYAGREMARLDTVLASGSRPDRILYQVLTHGLGLMCARELEASDPEFCDAVYGMLEEIRVEAGC